MAKELPYFKFEPNQWENGNIQMFSRADKGLFIDLCSMYWSRLGNVPVKLAIQKLCDGNASALNSLCDEKIIEVIEGNIYIKFLSEQLLLFKDVSQTNSKNAKERWEKARKQKELDDLNATALLSQCETDAIREEKIKEDKINKPTVKFSFFNSLLDLGLSKDLIDDWLAVRKTKKATNTKTAFNNLLIEVEKSGKPINEIINKCVTESWSGFKASWNWQTNNINNQQIKLENNETVRQMSAAVRNHNPNIKY